jgi:hypothetical protein
MQRVALVLLSAQFGKRVSSLVAWLARVRSNVRDAYKYVSVPAVCGECRVSGTEAAGEFSVFAARAVPTP